VSTSIPFWALNNEKLKNFLEVNCGCSIPDESILKKNYLSKCYNNILEMIRNKVHWKIVISTDKTCNTEARYVANVIPGILKIDGPCKAFLLTNEVSESVYHSTICKLFDRSMFLLWPVDIFVFCDRCRATYFKSSKSIEPFHIKLVYATW
jgi:hypothetical protein